jgi:hypothetical protein
MIWNMLAFKHVLLQGQSFVIVGMWYKESHMIDSSRGTSVKFNLHV